MVETIDKIIDKLKAVFLTSQGNINLIGKIGISIFIALLALLLVKILNKIIKEKIIEESLVQNNSRVKTATTVAHSFAKVFVYVLAVLIILDVMGVNTRSILAVAGIGGLTVAFATQSIVKDVINGSFLLFENQFDIGDWVEIKGRAGTVVGMGIRTTKIQDFSGQIHMIPNGQIDIVTNHSKNNMKAVVDIGLRTDADLEKVQSIIEGSLIDDEIFVSAPSILGIVKLDEFSYTIRITAITKAGNQWAAERLIRKQVLKGLQDNGLVGKTNLDEKIRKKKNGEI